MTIRKDYQNGIRSDGEFFMPEPTKPVAVFYTTRDGDDVWSQDFSCFGPDLSAFITMLKQAGRVYRVFGFWPGKKRSDLFPLDEAEVLRRCGGFVDG